MTALYVASRGGPLRQCEIISNLRRFQAIPWTIGTGLGPLYYEPVEPLTIVLTQDCDLEQDFRVRFTDPRPGSDKLLDSIELFAVDPAAEVFASLASGNRKQWDRFGIDQNTNERFQFLEKVPPESDALGLGLPEMVIDFKQVFTMPADELYHRLAIGEARRRCALASPYLEHLSTRRANYRTRVALPSPHRSD